MGKGEHHPRLLGGPELALLNQPRVQAHTPLLLFAASPVYQCAVEYGIIDRVLEPEDEEVRRVVRESQMPA